MSSAQNTARAPRTRDDAGRTLFSFALTLLLVEFLDEVVFGVREAAWPLIRDDLRLTYTQVGVILSLPGVVGNLVEPSFGILGDVWHRRAIVLAGGVVFALATMLVGASQSFTALLLAEVLSGPAAGAFVGLSQAALMDAAPERREQNMVRWTLSGTLGNTLGPLVLGASVGLGWGWRWPFCAAGALALALVAAAWRFPFPAPAADGSRHKRARLAEGAREALRALRRREVLRWLVLLQAGDFTWDVLRGFLALYFVDVTGAGEARAALVVVVWTCASLPGELLLLALLRRVRGLGYLRVSTSFVLVLFPAFLLAQGFAAKVALLVALGLASAGGYAILKAQLYAELPGRSGTALTLGNVFGLAGSLFPLALGAFAQRFGLGAMMWLLAAGPAVVLAGLLTTPKSKRCLTR
jgi:FSR family fosmidomycin resistance protein-like MFS transporter